MANLAEVSSLDGTRITAVLDGDGPPLVLVPSVSADHTTFARVAPLLSGKRTLWMVDRRGRGASGDANGWSIADEYQDIAAVLRKAGSNVALLGYSWSAILALEAALLQPTIEKLVLYEPGFPSRHDPYPEGWIENVERMLDSGDSEGVVLSLLELAGLSMEEIDAMRGGPSWEARVAIAHTIPRECRSDATYEFQPARFASLGVPTLLLLGSATPEMYRRSVEDVHAALPNSYVIELEGVGHGAHHTAPGRFADAVLQFLAPPADPENETDDRLIE